MVEHKTVHKSKIQLLGFDWKPEIHLRLALSRFTPLDVRVLEEILFSPLKVPLKKIASTIQQEIDPSLNKLEQLGLCHVEGDHLVIDKEKRRYFEFQIGRFDPEVKPDMEFLQGLLRLFPIQLLPSWYAIPRTSNHIFSSIVEKYLFTPQIYQRYLDDLSCEEPLYDKLLTDLFKSPDLCLSAHEIKAKYHLDVEAFEELLMQLELHFACCLSYRKENGVFQAVVTPFYEWERYLRFLRKTEAPFLSNVIRKHTSDFAFIEDMSSLLISATKRPISISKHNEKAAEALCAAFLAKRIDTSIKALPSAADWLSLRLENRAMQLYRQPLFDHREAEKIVKRALHGQWLLIDEYLTGIVSHVTLISSGKHWDYALPVYTDLERAAQRALLTEGLFHVGITSLGTYKGQDAFSITPFGRLLFEE